MSRPVRILQVCAIDTTAWLLLRPQLEAMRDRGWEVTVACSEGPNLARLRERGIATEPVAIARSSDVRSHLRSVLALLRVIHKGRFDVVHVHTPVASLVGRLAARLARVPLVIYTAHGFYFHDEMAPAQRWRHVWLERTFGRMTDHLFTQSAEDAQTAVDEGIMPAGTVTVIGNGVKLEAFEQPPEGQPEAWRARFSISPETFVVGIVGRAVEEKGFREYFQAAKLLAERHPGRFAFLVVGGGVEGDRDGFQAEMAAFVAEPPLAGCVHFTGFTEEIPALMNAMDVFVLPSYREGMPRSIIEAMGAGKPVVATDIRGCREEVVEGETGFLIPLRDASALADRIERLAADPGLRARMGEAGRSRARAHFHENDVIARLNGGIAALLQARGLALADDVLTGTR